jgi:predicted nicotinamide N-methyase
MTRQDAQAVAFVRANTRLLSPPHVPEIRLHLADEAFSLWRMTEEEFGLGDLPPFWGFAWAGGQALARYLIDHPDLVRGRTVFDLASGSGIVAIAAAKAGAAAVAASDIDRLAISAIALNAELNDVMVAIVQDDLLDGDPGPAEVVLAGDVFYERSMADRVLPFLERARARGALVLVGDPDRALLPRPRFELVATYQVSVTPALEDSGIKRTTVWRLPVSRDHAERPQPGPAVFDLEAGRGG